VTLQERHSSARTRPNLLPVVLKALLDDQVRLKLHLAGAEHACSAQAAALPAQIAIAIIMYTETFGK
jgi:hypothetical protein